MLTSRRGGFSAAALSLTLILSAASGANAADGPCRRGCPTDPGTTHTDANAGGGSLEVTVSGTGVRQGGGSYTVPGSTVHIAPTCFYRQFMTGKEYAAAWASNGQFTYTAHHLPPEDQFEPEPGYLDHKDDDEGHWWYPSCDAESWTGPEDKYAAYRDAYYDTHKTMYVEATERPPVADAVPPEKLAQVAFEATTIEPGTVHWNPTRKGDDATFVGLDTWVWLDDSPTHLEVTASIPGLSATVTSTLEGLHLSADGADSDDCDGTGTPWSAGATTDCRLTFDRSSANQPVKAGHDEPTTTLTADAVWNAAWTSTDGDGGTLDDQTITSTAEVPVAEIQSVVNAAR